MKKIVILGVTVSLLILTAGCTSKVGDSTSSSHNNSNTETSKSSTDNISSDEKAALEKAKQYSDMMHMSKKRIYTQLTSEFDKFDSKSAQYAIDNVQADWNNNAYEQAKSYQTQMSMSSQAIYDQLISQFDQFEPEQAKYAVEKLTGEKINSSSSSDSSSSSSSSEYRSSSSNSSSSVDKTETKPSSEEKTKKAAKKSKFYIMDKIMSESSTIGNTEMTIDTYNDLAINGFTLEGCIAKFGVPQYATESSDGDIMQEVLYNSNEEGYSVGLVFKYDKNAGGFGSWKLDDKYAVETTGTSIPEYTYNP